MDQYEKISGKCVFIMGKRYLRIKLNPDSLELCKKNNCKIDGDYVFSDAASAVFFKNTLTEMNQIIGCHVNVFGYFRKIPGGFMKFQARRVEVI